MGFFHYRKRTARLRTVDNASPGPNQNEMAPDTMEMKPTRSSIANLSIPRLRYIALFRSKHPDQLAIGVAQFRFAHGVENQ